MPYNVSWANETNTLGEAFVNIALTGGNYFGSFLLLAIFIIILAVFKNYDTRVVFSLDSFICVIVAVILWAIGVVSPTIILLPSVLLVASLIYLVWGG